MQKRQNNIKIRFPIYLLNHFSLYYIEEESKTKNIEFLNKSKMILYNGGGMKLFVYCFNPKCIFQHYIFYVSFGI